MPTINHGTFSIYTPTMSERPVAPQPPDPFPPLAPGASSEQQTAHTAAVAAYNAAVSAYEQERASWLETVAPIDRLAALVRGNAVFARRADGTDWYDFTRGGPSDRHYCLVINGAVTAVAADAQMFGIVDGMTLIETTEPAEIGWTWDGSTLAAPAIAVLRSAKAAAAWTECERRTAAAVATVSISGTPQVFGCDAATRENIIGINGLIAQETAGLLPPGTVPNPRPWTPKGAASPVMVTHAEFAAIGVALAAKKESHVVAYLTHKAALTSLTTAAAIAAHDITTGWPAA